MMWTCPRLKIRDDFRVVIHDGSGEFRLQLQGHLGSAESREIESCWRTAASTIAGRRFTVDLSSVRSLDTTAAELLSQMQGCGAELVRGSQRLQHVGGVEKHAAEPSTTPGTLLSLSPFATLLACIMLRIRIWAR